MQSCQAAGEQGYLLSGVPGCINLAASCEPDTNA
jgi:hypothetical protein